MSYDSRHAFSYLAHVVEQGHKDCVEDEPALEVDRFHNDCCHRSWKDDLERQLDQHFAEIVRQCRVHPGTVLTDESCSLLRERQDDVLQSWYSSSSQSRVQKRVTQRDEDRCSQRQTIVESIIWLTVKKNSTPCRDWIDSCELSISP